MMVPRYRSGSAPDIRDVPNDRFKGPKNSTPRRKDSSEGKAGSASS